jgi:hypothetical protein
MAQTAIIGPADQYAFQWDNGSGATSLGLFFNSTENRYEFRDISGVSNFELNPVSNIASFQTRLGIGVALPSADFELFGDALFGNYAGGHYLRLGDQGDMTFEGDADYLVGNNRYAFRAAAAENYGLFFNATSFRYEFRDGSALPKFYIDANTGELVTESNLRIGNGSSAVAGNIRFNGTDFEGFDGSNWLSFSSGAGGADAKL